MKKLLVNQSGKIEVEVARQFVVEVADDATEVEIIEKLKTAELPETEEMAWSNTGDDHKWLGYEAQLDHTEIDDFDGVATEDLAVIKLI